MDMLSNIDTLFVRQKKEWGEILTGFETCNKYEIADGTGNPLLLAAEVGGGFLTSILRLFLKALRPFEIQILTPDGQMALSIQRPFRFYFYQVSVYDAGGELLGTVRRKFSLLRRMYTVADSSGTDRIELFGPILHPWTFEIRKGGVAGGKITKKWSGLGKEAFTDADNFGIEFPGQAPPSLRAVLLGAVFLIDLVHFEKQ